MKKFFEEFKEFAMRGSVVDLAVGMVIGAAFKAIVDSLAADIISPLIGLAAGGGQSLAGRVWQIGSVSIGYGAFLTAVINFVLMAFVLFMMVKAVNRAKAIGRKPEEEKPEPRLCPYCKGEVAGDATRCPHCTSKLEP